MFSSWLVPIRSLGRSELRSLLGLVVLNAVLCHSGIVDVYHDYWKECDLYAAFLSHCASIDVRVSLNAVT